MLNLFKCIFRKKRSLSENTLIMFHIPHMSIPKTYEFVRAYRSYFLNYFVSVKAQFQYMEYGEIFETLMYPFTHLVECWYLVDSVQTPDVKNLKFMYNLMYDQENEEFLL